jgi:hypothetical protein
MRRSFLFPPAELYSYLFLLLNLLIRILSLVHLDQSGEKIAESAR